MYRFPASRIFHVRYHQGEEKKKLTRKQVEWYRGACFQGRNRDPDREKRREHIRYEGKEGVS